MPEIVGRARMPRLAAAPASPMPGELYYDTGTNILYYWNGSAWISTQSSAGTIYDSDQIGVIKAFSGAVIPTNWMLADGRTLQRADYPQLADALGVAAGAVTFTLPDYRNRFLYGVSDTSELGQSGGAATHTLVATEMPVHSHTVNSHSHTVNSHSHGGGTNYVSSDHSHGFSTSANGNHYHRPGTTSENFARTVGTTAALGSGGTARYIMSGYDANTTWSEQGDHSHSGQTGGISANHTHQVYAEAPGTDAQAPGTNSQGGGAAHNNMPPYVKAAWIIKVTGAQIDSGGALVGATGPKGDPGPWRGVWAAATAYAVGESVSYFDGLVTASYRRKIAGTTAGNPKTDTTNWELIASGGSVGADGAVKVFEQPGDPGAQAVGTLWIDTDDVPPAWTSLVPVVSVLPTNPVDGQEVYFQTAAMATDGIMWHLRYRLSSSSIYKWEFIGGPDLVSIFGQDNYGAPAYGSYFQPGGAVVGITTPLAGDYDVTGTGTAQMNTTGACSHHIAIFKGGVQQTSDQAAWVSYAAQYDKGHSTVKVRLAAVAVATVLEVRAKINRGGSETFYLPRAEFTCRPVRVG